MSDFKHITIEISARQVVTPQDETITVCLVESNTPLQFAGKESEEMKKSYVLGQAIEPRQPLQLDVKPFCLIIENCGSSIDCYIDCYVTAPSTPDAPRFMWSIVENDEIIKVGSPSLTFEAKADFCLIDFGISQRLRIETIPNADAFYEAREAVDRKRGA